MNNALLWARLYADLIDHPDYMLLTDTARAMFLEFICLACKDGGTGEIVSVNLQYRMRRHPNQIRSGLDQLVRIGWVSVVTPADPGGCEGGIGGGVRGGSAGVQWGVLLTLPGWSSRQPRSDHSGGSRVSKHRENQRLADERNVTRNVTGNVTVTADVTPQRRVEERRVEGEEQQPPLPPASGGSRVAVADATGSPADVPPSPPMPPEKPERVTRWTAKTFTQEQAALVFDRWRVYFKKDKRTIFSADRIKTIHARAKQGMTLVEAKLAVLGCVEDGKRWYAPGDCKVSVIGAMIEWNYIFRNRTSVEKYMAIALKKLGENGVHVSDDGNSLVDRNGNEVTSVRL